MWLDQSPRGHSIRDSVGNPCGRRGQPQSQMLDVFEEMTNYAAIESVEQSVPTFLVVVITTLYVLVSCTAALSCLCGGRG